MNIKKKIQIPDEGVKIRLRADFCQQQYESERNGILSPILRNK